MRTISLLLCILLLCACTPAYAAAGLPPASTPTLRGIDVSAWQGDIDWQAVSDSGIRIAILRASEGYSVVDAQFERNYAGAKTAGVAVGFYHFMTASTPEEAVRQADFFLRVIEGKTPECLLALDVGADGSLSPRELTAAALAFMQHVEEQSGLRIMLYTDAYAARARYGDELARYPLWVANYGVPEPEANGKWSGWVGFQYGDSGTVPGIHGLVDLDWFTREVYQNTPPAPAATPVPTPQITATPAPCATACPQPAADGTLHCRLIREAIRIDELADELQVSISDLLSLNTIVGNVAQTGQLIRYPAQGQAVGAFSSLHILQERESLSTLARHYGTTVKTLRALNGFDKSRLTAGQMVRLPQLTRYETCVPAWVIEYTVVVQKGETIEVIAERYGMTAELLTTINRQMAEQKLHAGQLLRLAPYGNGSRGVFRGGYMVQKGDTLGKIAKRFDVTLQSLTQCNNIPSKNHIYPGMILMIPALGDAGE